MKDINTDACIKGAGIGSIYIRNTDACIKGAGIESIYIRNTYTNRGIGARDLFFARSVYVKNVFVEGAYSKSTFARDTSIFKHSKMHLQSFSILELKLFGT